ncbi:MAG: exopolyphosphatase [Chitinophagaceae bacterium]|nr:MAG: exopolyphosphatase [Chitinophagaceae bacterium]
MILAAIDIGSNAARLLITEVIDRGNDKPEFNKLNLVRVPLRLGFDVFETSVISAEKITMFLDTMLSFKHLMDAYKVQGLKACATSAMRDAANAAEILKKVQQATGIQIEVISGDTEANLVYENHVAENMDTDHSYMYIDVGGGSTEISFFTNGILIFKNSFNIGTIRLLKNLVTDAHWEEMKNSIKAAAKGQKEVVAIGSGGNINKVFSLSKRKDGKPLQLDLLRDYYNELIAFPVEERMERYKMRRDRADVIVPALSIYVNAMRWANANEIYVPKIGLADGLVQHLWEEMKTSSR